MFTRGEIEIFLYKDSFNYFDLGRNKLVKCFKIAMYNSIVVIRVYPPLFNVVLGRFPISS